VQCAHTHWVAIERPQCTVHTLVDMYNCLCMQLGESYYISVCTCNVVPTIQKIHLDSQLNYLFLHQRSSLQLNVNAT
jgi:hypothetical protein